MARGDEHGQCEPPHQSVAPPLTQHQAIELKEIAALFRTTALDAPVRQDVRDSIIDHITVLELELAKPKPDTIKLRRYAVWLVEKQTGDTFLAAWWRLANWLTDLDAVKEM